MAPELRFTVVLVGSLLLWSPALLAFLAGDLDVAAVGTRYAAALGVVALAVHLLASLLHAEPSPASGAEHQDEDDVAAAATPRRRAGDRPAADGTAPASPTDPG